MEKANENLKTKSKMMIGIFGLLGIIMIATIIATNATGKGTYSEGAKAYVCYFIDDDGKQVGNAWYSDDDVSGDYDTCRCVRNTTPEPTKTPVIIIEQDCSEYTNPDACRNSGYCYYYDDGCHSNPKATEEPTPDSTSTASCATYGYLTSCPTHARCTTTTISGGTTCHIFSQCESGYVGGANGCYLPTPTPTATTITAPCCVTEKSSGSKTTITDNSGCQQAQKGGANVVAGACKTADTKCGAGLGKGNNTVGGGNTCTACNIGYYSSANDDTCHKCDSGKTTVSTASTGSDKCVDITAPCCDLRTNSTITGLTDCKAAAQNSGATIVNGACVHKVTFTFLSNDESRTIAIKSCTITADKTYCTITAPTVTEEDFNGWGVSKECKSGSWQNNYQWDKISRETKDTTYYACKSETTEEKDSDFDKNKCGYSGAATVTRDEEYKNKCTYVNITYTNNNGNNKAGNVHACCTAKGGIWVGRNFTSSGYGNEYCIFCGLDDDNKDSVDPTDPPVKPTNPPVDPTDPPATPTPGPGGEVKTCYVCVSGEQKQYVWASSGANAAKAATELSNITSKNCATTSESNCEGITVTNCYECNGSKKYVMADSDAEAKTKSGGTSCTVVVTDKCNTVDPPKTGTFGIVVAWIIGMMTIGYAMWYFKKSSSLS